MIVSRGLYENRETSQGLRRSVVSSGDCPSCSAGTYVLIQSKNKKWNKQGVIIETLDNRQYRIKVKGSGRVTLRNRRFIKPCSIIQPQTAITTKPHHHQIPIDISLQTQTAQENEQTNTNTTSPADDIAQPLPQPPHGEGGNNNDAEAPPAPPRVPLAIRKLMTFNQPGLKESSASSSRR